MELDKRIDLFIKGVEHLDLLTKAQEDDPNLEREKVILHELMYLVEEMQSLEDLLEE